MALNREINWDSLSTLLLHALHEWTKENLHTGLPGIIDSYDAGGRRASVRPALLQVLAGEIPGEDGEMIERALAVNVPVLWNSTRRGTIHMPLEAGDRGFLHFSERGMTAFKATGELAEPDKTRFFSEADGVFYPCDFGHPRMTPASATGITIQTHDGATAFILEAGRITLRTPGDTLVVQ